MDVTILYFFFKFETPLSLILGGMRIHNLLILGQTSKPSCPEAGQDDCSCLSVGGVVFFFFFFFFFFLCGWSGGYSLSHKLSE